jgi:hypothetical protein
LVHEIDEDSFEKMVHEKCRDLKYFKVEVSEHEL